MCFTVESGAIWTRTHARAPRRRLFTVKHSEIEKVKTKTPKKTIEYFRANMLFSQFDIQGDADRLLIYLTAFASGCIKQVVKGKVATKDEAVKALHQPGKKFELPGDPNFLPGLGHFFEKPSSKTNADFLKQYLTQCRTELAARLIERIYNEDGTPNKWWMAYSKKNFMGAKEKK